MAERDRAAALGCGVWCAAGAGQGYVWGSWGLIMPVHRRVETTEIGDVTVVRFVDRKILDTANIQELGDELFALVEQDNRKSLLLNFSRVEFLSSAALNKLILLDRAVKKQGGRLKLCSLRPEIQHVFVITRLNQIFEIYDQEPDALGAF
jgi:anti-sigma B factor antagonist